MTPFMAGLAPTLNVLYFYCQVPLSIKAPLTKLEKNYGQFVWLLLLFFNLIFTF